MKSTKRDRQPVKRSRQQLTTQVSTAELDAALEQMREVERLDQLLEQQQAGSEPKSPVQFTISPEDGKRATACNEGDERQVIQWLFNGAYQVLGANCPGGEYGTSLLETVRTILLSSQPQTPLESIVLTQVLAAQHMAMRFSEKALLAKDAESAGRFADRAARFMELSCRQAETIMKLRGGHQQRVVVEHVHVGEGGQAVIGAVTAGATPGTPPKNDERTP